MKRLRLWSALSVMGLSAMVLAVSGTAGAGAAAPPTYRSDCRDALPVCTEVSNPQEAFGNYYVGHDEPSTLFYSNTPGSGNHMQYQLTVPSDPTGAYSAAKAYTFEERITFWFGMAMCDTQSYPEQLHTCTPDSDTNIVDPTQTSKAPGAAFMELQFYPPGFIPQFAGASCDPTRWCIALNIDSLAEDPILGTTLNATCQGQLLGGIEPVNFAFLTLDGKPLGPPNPLQFDPATSGNPKNADTFFLNQGDQASVTLQDTAAGLQAIVADTTTGQSGSMVASAANGFAQVNYQPHGHGCSVTPYNFHPMYATSSPQTRVLWAAHTYNTAYADEIGHFDFCTHVSANTGACDGMEGAPGDQEAADADDAGCGTADTSLLYPVTGCLGENTPGFDGPSYLRAYWPDGSATRPTPVLFSAPRTGGAFNQPYSQVAFEANLPRIEAADLGGVCNRTTGAGCVNPPVTDEGTPADFYPYFSTVASGTGCVFGEGGALAGTIDNFGGSSTAEYGPLQTQTGYTFGAHGATHNVIDNNNSGPIANPC